MKIAMWSGPRNLSTAMMYSFGNRPDCAVVDEPFYAAYLHRTGIDHPMRDDILASQPTSAHQVAAGLVGPNPAGKDHVYQKHMTQHMVPGVPRGWMRDVVNVFLIRHPARVIASYAARRPRTGIRARLEIKPVTCINSPGIQPQVRLWTFAAGTTHHFTHQRTNI